MTEDLSASPCFSQQLFFIWALIYKNTLLAMETVIRKSFGYHPGSSLTSHPQHSSCNVPILLGPQWRQELSFPKPLQPLPYLDHLPCTQAAPDSRLASSFLLIPLIALLLIVLHHPFPHPVP